MNDTPRFGTAGLADSYTVKKFDPAAIAAYTAGFGLTAFEYQCGRGVRLAHDKAHALGEACAARCIALSVHAPYYISMSSLEEDKRLHSIDYLLQSCALVKALGGKRVIFHSGSCGKQSREEALEKALDTMARAVKACDEAGYGDCILCPETMGKVNQLGTLDEVLALCEVDPRITPCIDFGHLYARSCGVQFADATAAADYAALLDTLGDYAGSAALAKEYRYQQAQAEAASGNYDAAIVLYTELAGYADSDALCRASRYEKAVAAQEAGDYAGAMALFADAGQYADSMARLRECCKQQGISIYYFSQDAVNAGVDTGYAKQDTISGDDKHFGWRLGRFFLTGFTRVTADENQQPVFIKTLGDSVTLWFDLEQDIDALNGNAQLSLAADANGYDQQFGIPKTNFGRGTLIVRHTDYQNAKNEPAVYTDYLLAKGTTGANTRIVLHEEGDYEVALDYEVQDGELTHITSKFGNYRIFLRFSIRNGNCMVYPFDLLTGAELQNTAVAEAGFSLDLARSRYLDINVRRAVLVETANGVIEDERFNRPAKDGDRYTQEGIYTISVSNRYTGESTTKTIFVGSQELLETYVRNGFSLERLK